MRKKNANNLLPTTRKCSSMGTKETHVSLNKSEVIRKDWGSTYMMKKQFTS